MTANISTLDKIHRIETLYRQGYQSELIERALDKLLAQEEMRAERATLELQQRLRAFEQQYQLKTQEFYRRYEAGELDDSADFMEWSSFYDMWRSSQEYLDWLRGSV
jgi:hypothetical protein